MVDFQAHTIEENQQVLGQYFLNDRTATNKNIAGSNLYKMFLGLAGEFKRVDDLFQSVWDGTNILTTNDPNYMALWEGAVGIPDDIFVGTSSDIEERRKNVLLKLRSLNVLTEQDFIDLAAILGQSITIKHGIEVAYPPYTPPFIPIRNSKSARFIWIIQGENLDLASYPPYNVPFFPSSPSSQLSGLFEALKPTMTTLIFQNL
ncbi:MAG: hypothetical protein ACJAY9_000772 [Flavobacteriales bacterium]|jgi:hypothetical protein